MSKLRDKALNRPALTYETVESFWDGTRSGTAEQCLRAVCESHERLRHDLEGAKRLLAESQAILEKIKEVAKYLIDSDRFV